MSAPATKSSQVDVLIIGAGPSGLMAANGLARAGVNVRIIDQRPTKVAAGQADGIQPRTTEVLQSYGLAERLIREGNQMHMAAFYAPGPTGGIELTGRTPDITTATARYPFGITLHQGAIESIFLDSMKESNLGVDRPIIPTSLELSSDEKELQDINAYPVKVTLKHLEPRDPSNDTEIVHAKFVLGSDGAHSWTRKALGIEMEGSQTEYVWGVVDFIPDTNFPDIRNRCNIHSNNGSCMVIPREGDYVRLYVQLSSTNAVLDDKGRIDKSKIGPKELLEVGRKSFAPYTFETPKDFLWWTLYNIGQRVASKFSVSNRAFISGDACHTHSPKAGQGMNASINDTHNLVWKLTYVLRGWAKMDLLSTYELERRAYALELIDFDRKYSKLFSGKPRTQLNEEGVSNEEFFQAFHTFGSFTSGIGIHYSLSSIVQSTPPHQALASGLIIGQRVPPITVIRAANLQPFELQDLLPADTRFKILVFTGTREQSWLQQVADEMNGWIEKRGWKSAHQADKGVVFDILAISREKKEDVRYNELPALFRSHWTKVFIDDTDVTGKVGGLVYETYGIGKEDGAIVVVRPDGYVATVVEVSANGAKELETYFLGFMA